MSLSFFWGGGGDEKNYTFFTYSPTYCDTLRNNGIVYSSTSNVPIIIKAIQCYSFNTRDWLVIDIIPLSFSFRNFLSLFCLYISFSHFCSVSFCHSLTRWLLFQKHIIIEDVLQGRNSKQYIFCVLETINTDMQNFHKLWIKKIKKKGMKSF